MHPIQDELLKSATAFLAALWAFSTSYGKQYPSTVEASHTMESEWERALACTEPESAAPVRCRTWRHRVYLVWDSTFAATASALYQGSKALKGASRVCVRLCDAIGDRRPSLMECRACGYRELEDQCKFVDDDPVCNAVCLVCIRGVIARANQARIAGDPVLTDAMLARLLTLKDIPSWKRGADYDDARQIAPSIRLSAIRELRTMEDSVMTRWLLALSPVAGRVPVLDQAFKDAFRGSSNVTGSSDETRTP